MGKRRKVPDDLMDTILSENLTAEDETPSGSRASPGSGRMGVTFNLSKRLGADIEWLRGEFREGGSRPSRSEIAEAALRIAVEDVRGNGDASELSRRLRGHRMEPDTSAATRRSVDESGWIFETTHDENGEIIDEDVVGTVAELPITDEYMDEGGRLVSVAKDELGNTFEQIMDESMNTIGARLLPSRDAP